MLCGKTNELLLYGSSFRTAPVVEREKMQELLQKEIENGSLPLNEALLLTTCNRVELYAVADSSYKLKNILDDDLKSGDAAYFMSGQEVVRHLLKVSLGMDSLLPGEEGITHQVKSAMVKYQKTKLARAALGSVFSSVIRSSWNMRKLYGVRAEGEEIGNIIAGKVKENMGSGFRVTIVGSGRTAQEVYKSLRDYTGGAYIVTKRALLPSELSGAKIVDYDSLGSALEDSQVVISATNTDIGNYLLTAINLPGNIKLLVDLSVPRSIDPAVRGVGFELWDMDFISRLLHDYRFSYPEEINRAINETADRIYYNVYFRRLEGSVQRIYASAYRMALNESINAQKLLKKGKIDESVIMRNMAEKIVKKMLEPLVEVPKDPSSVNLKLSMIRALYGDELNDKIGN
ncbi:MAG: hypothetical protein JRN26_07680 [Nitrososphaerota archaeon]|jgi:glutamyl-tRNA reductase|nr:hypothetical protein [Nitrososphaerota archaeon]MDG6927304.1 hypothetical protein [Nitrososphaerota archaeon]MDG6930338.1 hypothetical protein [Nitrososphaerota archaeon]MDG6931694.1 hypothetical protein [Nitrososphaerota archaeon]MDG6936742.1 hypothetical protein [Nitrososphaerota archaeon]